MINLCTRSILLTRNRRNHKSLKTLIRKRCSHKPVSNHTFLSLRSNVRSPMIIKIKLKWSPFRKNNCTIWLQLDSQSLNRPGRKTWCVMCHVIRSDKDIVFDITARCTVSVSRTSSPFFHLSHRKKSQNVTVGRCEPWILDQSGKYWLYTVASFLLPRGFAG